MYARSRPILELLNRPTPIATLAVFRVLFGAVMAYSAARFLALGWVEAHFIAPQVHFTYYGFGWVKPLPAIGMYAVQGLMLAGAVGVMLGAWYRVAAAVFFLTFTYTHLLDVSYYLNHYYFVSLIAFWMIWLPAHRYFSMDVWRRPDLARSHVPAWMLGLLKGQIVLVYLYAGLAKINPDWLLHALPLRLWLPAQDALPLIGPVFAWTWTPYIFSWAGMMFDVSIGFWLLWRPARPYAYLAVVVFHALTGLLFNIGVFPLVMTAVTVVFFSEKTHERLLAFLRNILQISRRMPINRPYIVQRPNLALMALAVYAAFQVAWPWRFALYPGTLFWNEEGFRFGWRVMLMEKAGDAVFYVRSGDREGVVDNRQFLTDLQEKQMTTQPDLILQYAHHLGAHYRRQGMQDPQVRVEAFVTLNGRPGRLLVDPQVNLLAEREGFGAKNWILHEDVR